MGRSERVGQDSTRGASLGIVSGRRRQGKTFLLRALCQATGGFYFAAEEATDAESLQLIGAALADHLGGSLTLDVSRPSRTQVRGSAHPLTILEDCGLIVHEPDAFRGNRTNFRIAEPLITFHHAVMRPIWSDLEHTRDASRL